MTDREFYVVTTATGEVLNIGHPAALPDGSFPNIETASEAAIASWPHGNGDPMHIVRCTHIRVANVTGTTQVVVEPLVT